MMETLLRQDIMEIPLEVEELNVMDYGADNSGRQDLTELLTLLHASGRRVYYPNGVYRFNGETLDLSGGVRFESPDGVTVRNDISEMNILRFDADGHLIGLMHNHLEYDESYGFQKNGSLVPPPVLTKKPQTRVDFMVYWYNDFGLQAQIHKPWGWKGWHYWTWNHHNCEERIPDSQPYDPARHPLLGFYYGDDPVVLDWQSYWLCKYGVSAAILLAGTLEEWESEQGYDHWLYELFHHTPNFRNLRYVVTGTSRYLMEDDAETVGREIQKQWQALVDKIYTCFDNYYVVEQDGKRYPVMSIWEENGLPTVFDPQGGCANTEKAYRELAAAFRQAGFDGVAILCRNPIPAFNEPEKTEALRQEGLIRIPCTYVANYVSDRYLSGEMTYPEVVDSFAPDAADPTIIGVATSINSHTPHPSKWVCPGNTPADFGRWVSAAVEFLERHPERLQLITCYNLSEWAEGGSGLQPNVQDGFGYLEAVAEAVCKTDHTADGKTGG